MTSEDRGAAAPYTEYDNLSVLHVRERDPPLLHPYGTVEVGGRYITPAGTADRQKGWRAPSDHAGPPWCPAQLTTEKNALFERLGLAAEGHGFTPGAVTMSPPRGRCCGPSRCGPGASASPPSFGPRSPSNSATSAPPTGS